MFLAGPKFKNPPASKLASDFRPFDPGIILLLHCSVDNARFVINKMINDTRYDGISAILIL